MNGVRIAPTAILHPGVEIGEGSIVEDYCIVGAPFRGQNEEKTVIGKNAWIRSGTVIYAGNRIGDHFSTGNKANLRELNEIGNDVSIGTLTVVEHHVRIGDGVRIHSQAFIPEYTVLEREAWIGPQVTITNAKFPRSPNVKESLVGAHVEEKAKIGANSTLLPGVRIGKNSLIGAGSVVTKDVPPGMIAFGQPSEVHRPIHYE